MIAATTQRYLLDIARASLAEAMERPELAGTPVPRPEDPAIVESSRVFVSWHLGERLVGCIGTLEPTRSLEEGVRRYSVHAGLHDPRTPAPSPSDLSRMTCEISVLSDPQPLAVRGLAAIERTIVPGRDGVILELEQRRAVFLPVVWEKIPDPSAFLVALCRKARIDAEREGAQVSALTFVAERFEETHR